MEMVFQKGYKGQLEAFLQNKYTGMVGFQNILSII